MTHEVSGVDVEKYALFMSTNLAKTLVWKHGNDVKLWRHKQHTKYKWPPYDPEANPPHKFSAYATDHSTHVVAWFVSELPDENVFAKQVP